MSKTEKGERRKEVKKGSEFVELSWFSCHVFRSRGARRCNRFMKRLPRRRWGSTGGQLLLYCCHYQEPGSSVSLSHCVCVCAGIVWSEREGEREALRGVIYVSTALIRSFTPELLAPPTPTPSGTTELFR